MAILEKIRKRSLLLIAVIGISLILFLLSSLVGQGKLSLFDDTSTIGEVDGEPINRVAFAQMVQATTSRNPNTSQMAAVNSVWNSEVSNLILEKQFETLGIQIDGERIINIVKANPQFANQPQFQNENGVFDPEIFIDRIADLKASNPQAYEQWKMQEDQLINNAQQDVYYSLIQAGLGVTEKEGEISYAEESNSASFKYVYVPYKNVADSTVTVTDGEIESYMKKHKDEYEVEAGRNVRYVLFNEVPSKADTTALKNTVDGLAAQFRAATDVRDFNFENESDITFDSTYVAKAKLTGKYADTLYTLGVGESFGPYVEGNFYKISKMIARKEGGSVKVSHILIQHDSIPNGNPKESRTEEEAQELADELLAKAKKGEDFAELAKEYSEDPGSASKGGWYDNVVPKQMVPKFDEFIFNHAKGEMGVVKTDFGFHVIRVDDIYETVNIATYGKKFVASEETLNEIYNESNKMAFEVSESGKDFEAVADELGVEVKTYENLGELADGLPGVTNQRSIVRWAFDDNTKVTDVKKDRVSNGYIVIQVTGKTKKGLMSVAKARPAVGALLIKEKKAEKIIADGKGLSMQDLASANRTSVRTASNITLKNPTIPGAGNEPKVLGTAFGLSQGSTSGLIEGENGVFMIEVTEKVDAPTLQNYTTYRNTLKQQNVQKYSAAVIDALKKSVEIEDRRAEFY